MPLRIDFVRHGQSVANAEGIVQGQSVDTKLTQKGIEQIQSLKEETLCDWDVVFSSDSKRCLESARLLADDNREIIVDKRLRERSLGRAEGQLRELVNFSNLQDMESVDSVVNRGNDWIRDLKDDQKVLCVTHSQFLLKFFHSRNLPITHIQNGCMVSIQL